MLPGKPIAYKATKRLDVAAVHSLFRRSGWNAWFSRSDVEWYLRRALYVASAWSGSRCVGIAVLTGDGRINTWLDLLLVDEPFRHKGIGSVMMGKVVARIEKLNPYHMALDVFERSTQRFYARFGFSRNKGAWLLEHTATADQLRRMARAARARKRK